VLPDSSRVDGKLWLPSGKYPHLEIKTEDKRKLEFSPTQVAYFKIGADKFIPVRLAEKGGSGEASTTPVFAKVLITGKLEAVQYSYYTGGLLIPTLMIRQRGTDPWAQVVLGGFKMSTKQLREAVSPLVADQPPHAKVLAAGRINHQNLVEFIRSYNAYAAAQQH
jgi:hypothetical protein